MERHLRILEILKNEYPNEIALEHKDPMQLLVATILSAQCTDERVNVVTEDLFRKYKTPEDYANANQREFEQEIRSTGFYRAKAKNIINAARMIGKDFSGRVPDNMEDLLKLPGVARKTANIVLTNGFGKVEGIAVDTHVKRLAFRMGFTKNKDPDKIERDLTNLFPKSKWNDINMSLVWHGRRVCQSRKPLCRECKVSRYCPKVGI
jgi:endonuclease-3